MANNVRINRNDGTYAQLTAQAKANTMNTVTCKHCQKELVRAETVSARPMQGWATIEESQNRFLCNYGSFVTQHVPVSRAHG